MQQGLLLVGLIQQARQLPDLPREPAHQSVNCVFGGRAPSRPTAPPLCPPSAHPDIMAHGNVRRGAKKKTGRAPRRRHSTRAATQTRDGCRAEGSGAGPQSSPGNGCRGPFGRVDGPDTLAVLSFFLRRVCVCFPRPPCSLDGGVPWSSFPTARPCHLSPSTHTPGDRRGGGRGREGRREGRRERGGGGGRAGEGERKREPSAREGRSRPQSRWRSPPSRWRGPPIPHPRSTRSVHREAPSLTRQAAPNRWARCAKPGTSKASMSGFFSMTRLQGSPSCSRPHRCVMARPDGPSGGPAPSTPDGRGSIPPPQKGASTDPDA